MCVNTSSQVVPYSLRLLVSRMQQTGRGRVERHAFGVMEFGASTYDFPLAVPRGELVEGSVSGEVGGVPTPINAEVAFTPVGPRDPLAEAIFTQSRGKDYVVAGEGNLVANLAAGTQYEAHIIPLGAMSKLFPPTTLLLDTAATRSLDVLYKEDELDTLEGVLTDEEGVPTDEPGQEQIGRDVRLIDPLTRKAVSVTGTVGLDGKFAVRAAASTLSSGYILQLNLDPKNRWQTTLELKRSAEDSNDGNVIFIPAVPKRVTFKGRIERGSNPIASDLTFVSTFPRPRTVGDLHNRDWCKSSVPADSRPEPTCRTIVRAAANVEGDFSVELLPGDYSLYISPNNDSKAGARAQAAIYPVVIETQPLDGPQQLHVFKVSDSTSYSAYVRNERREPLAGVVVRAVALQTRGFLEDIAAYNRSAETVTDENGRFELGLDVGYYDLVARAGDGFPWVYATNIKVSRLAEEPDDEDRDPLGGFVIPAPLILEGTLLNADRPARNAAIDAYGEVTSLKGGKRLVLLGRTTSDADGRYLLALPPEIVDVSQPAK